MNVLLMCNAGMSTSIMKMKLEQEAGKRGIELQITAIPMGELKEYINETDAILLGPQIRFALKDVTAEAGEKPVMVIAPQDFGAMRADKVLEELLAVMNK